MIAEKNDVQRTNILKSIEKVDNKTESILLNNPSSSPHRVTFDFSPKIKLLETDETKDGAKKITKRPVNYEVRDKTIIVNKSMLNVVKKRAKKYTVIIPAESTVILKYKRKEDLEADLRILGFKPKTYVENKLIVHNFSFKETEESVKKYFSQFATVEKVTLEKNSKGLCTGKGTVSFSTSHNPISDSKLYGMRLNGRLLRIERIKKQIINSSRLFISHMNKSLKISELRSIIKEYQHVPKNIKIDLQDGRNKGYGFIEFNSPQEAQLFIEDFDLMRSKIGEQAFIEFSQEKNFNNKK